MLEGQFILMTQEKRGGYILPPSPEGGGLSSGIGRKDSSGFRRKAGRVPTASWDAQRDRKNSSRHIGTLLFGFTDVVSGVIPETMVRS